MLPVQLQTSACTSEQFSRMCHRPYPEMNSIHGFIKQEHAKKIKKTQIK